MESVVDRFLRYAAVDTQSADDQENVPSTPKQFDLALMLRRELEEMGAEDVCLSDHCYVTATIPAKESARTSVIGLIAHMDTSNAASGTDVRPVLHENYDGSDLVLRNGITISPKQYPSLLRYVGDTVITADGTTLLGADDKAGVAEIMTLCSELLRPDAPRHGTVRICFTPDEEVGRGVDFFDLEGFKADFAYTVDGGELGELNCETFNAARADVHVRGTSIHPGSAKGIMVNAVLVGMELQNLLPAGMNPALTEGREGFFHLDRFGGSVESADLNYIIRDHDPVLFRQKKNLMEAAVRFLNEKYGAGTVTLSMSDSYHNMKEYIDDKFIRRAVRAMERSGVCAEILPVRGGTDGSRLSEQGLPCPNLCTGGANFHGPYEFIPAGSMFKTVEILRNLVVDDEE